MIYKETDALRTLEHKHIVRLKLAFPLKERKSVVIVMEYCSGGDLKGYLQKRGRLMEDEACEIMGQLVEAVRYCHEKRIVHRDLKLHNVVFAKPNSRDIRVVDFGISGLFRDKSMAGSLKYMAPEILSGKNLEAGPAIDVFSMGVILYTLVTGKMPFDGTSADSIRRKIIKGIYSYPMDVPLSPHCKDLID